MSFKNQIKKTKRDLDSTRRGFDFLANFYDLMVFFTVGNSLIRAKNNYIQDLQNCKSILILGGGTGQFLSSLLESGYEGKVLYLDLSPKMTQKSKLRIQKHDTYKNVVFLVGEIKDLPKGMVFDCVVSNFFLDMFTNKSLVHLHVFLDSFLCPKPIWYFVDFVSESKSNDWRYYLLKPLYVFFRIFCNIEAKRLPDYNKFFEDFSWELCKKNDILFGLVSSRLYQRNLMNKII